MDEQPKEEDFSPSVIIVCVSKFKTRHTDSGEKNTNTNVDTVRQFSSVMVARFIYRKTIKSNIDMSILLNCVRFVLQWSSIHLLNSSL